MSDAAPALDREQLLARFERFASLRAARRALEPSLRSPDELRDAELTQQIRGRLQAVKRLFQARGADPAAPDVAEQDAQELRSIDGDLERFASGLRQVAAGVSIRQHRSVLPNLVREQPDEVLGLLELCADDDAELPNRMNLVEYLFTLLCIRRRDGVWTIVREPASLSSRIERCCESAADSDLGETEEIVDRFRNASERLGSGEEMGAVIREIASYKANLAGRFFHPHVLRAILHYNVFVRNIRDQEIRRERAVDREIRLDVAEESTPGEAAAPPPEQSAREATPDAPGEASAETTPEPPAPAPVAAVEPVSAFESPALAAIEDALRSSLSGGGPAGGAAGKIASRMNASRLRPWEVAAFTNPEGTPLEECLRRCVAVGCAADRDPESQGALAELGIDPEQLRRDWAREVGDRIQKEINHLIATDSFDVAQNISDSRNRLLYAPLSAAIRERTREMADHDTAPAAADSSAPLPEEIPTPATFSRAVEKKEKKPQKPKAAPRRKRAKSTDGARRLLATLALLVLGVMVGKQWLIPDPQAAQVLSGEHLSSVSTHLLSGYRNEQGHGKIFIGTVGPEWGRLAAEERIEAAEEIKAGLLDAGIEDIMLFNSRRVLQARWVGGKLRHWKTRGS